MNLSPLALQKFFDNNGAPLTGGLLYTYVAGTTTKIATYTDSTGGTPNTNPIVLNFRGEANVWLDPTLTYKFTLAPVGDTDPPTKPIWTVDNIASGLTLAQLTAQIIGQLLYPRSAAESAASVTPTNYAYIWGDLRRYGGSTGAIAALNSTALTSSIAQASQTGGSSVLVADGAYLVNGVSVSNYSGDGLYIEGREGKLTVGANQTALAFDTCENVFIKDLRFESAAVSGLAQRGISTNNCGRFRIAGCDFRTMTYGIYWGPTKVGLATGAFPIPSCISNNIVKACAAGIYCAPSGEYVEIANNIINDCTLFGITLDAGNVAVVDNVITGNDVGVQVDGGSTSNGDHGSIVGNTINHNAKANLVLKTLDYSMLVVGNNLWASIIPPYAAAPLDSSYGMLLQSAGQVTVTGNVFGNSVTNLALNSTQNCIFMQNVFIADNGRTVFNIKDVDGSSVNACIFGRNAFQGTLVAGANNNNTEQYYSIGVGTAPAFQNAWVNFGATFRNAAYYKDGDGIVHITGVVKTGAVNTPIFTLPAGFRPSASIIFATCSNSLFGYNQIDSNGDVICKVGSNVFVALDGLSFRAEA